MDGLVPLQDAKHPVMVDWPQHCQPFVILVLSLVVHWLTWQTCMALHLSPALLAMEVDSMLLMSRARMCESHGREVIGVPCVDLAGMGAHLGSGILTVASCLVSKSLMHIILRRCCRINSDGEMVCALVEST